MKIAVWHNLPSGGGKRALYDLVRGLVERGHTVEAWCPPTADRTYMPLDALVSEHVVGLPSRQYAVGGLIGSSLERWGAVPSLGRLDALTQHARQCASEIDGAGFDVLLANPCRFTRVPPIGRYTRLPSVLFLQEPNRWLYEARPNLPWVAGPRLRGPWWHPVNLGRLAIDLARLQGLRVLAQHELASARAYDMILVNSLFSRESVVRTYGINARVSYLGVDTRLFRDLGLEREDFVLGVGSISRSKGIEFAIDSLARLAEPRPLLVWAANACPDPGYLAALRQLAAHRRVPFDVRVGISDAELVGLLNVAAVMLYVPELEPFGLAPLEAGACGTPVVGVAEGGLRETIQNGVNGILVERDAAVVARALAELRANPAVARRLGQMAAEHVRTTWTAASATARLEAGLRQALHGH